MLKKELIIVKVGGNVIDSEENLFSFLKKFHSIKGHKILVHGGGKLATDLSNMLGIEAKMVDGKRITDAETLKVVVMVYSGINKTITTELNAFGTEATGICGANMNLLPAKKREKGNIDYGFVGDILLDKISSTEWQKILEQDICPVVAPLTADAKGQLLNTNADTIASSIAQALSQLYSVRLIYCFEKDGVLKDPNDNSSLIEHITPAEYLNLKSEGIISKGMIPKLDNAWEALRSGVDKVLIGNALYIEELTTSEHKTGTLLSL
ncbi:MAG TPA: acetylglutamate kinase [Bacteroidia bacterium]|nr:acetylglutamate kinase [Bacteroidia bacterium]